MFFKLFYLAIFNINLITSYVVKVLSGCSSNPIMESVDIDQQDREAMEIGIHKGVCNNSPAESTALKMDGA